MPGEFFFSWLESYWKAERYFPLGCREVCSHMDKTVARARLSRSDWPYSHAPRNVRRILLSFQTSSKASSHLSVCISDADVWVKNFFVLIYMVVTKILPGEKWVFLWVYCFTFGGHFIFCVLELWPILKNSLAGLWAVGHNMAPPPPFISYQRCHFYFHIYHQAQ